MQKSRTRPLGLDSERFALASLYAPGFDSRRAFLPISSLAARKPSGIVEDNAKRYSRICTRQKSLSLFGGVRSVSPTDFEKMDNRGWLCLR